MLAMLNVMYRAHCTKGSVMTSAGTRTDQRGNPLSTSSDTAVEAYTRGLDLFLSGNPGAAEAFEEAIAADQGFALARVALARTFARTDPKRARPMLDEAAQLGAGTTPHEQRHIAALTEPNPRLALALCEEHLELSPADAEVMNAAQFLRFQGGQPNRSQANFEMTERLADAYGEDDWWYLSQRAFVNHEVFRLEESRQYAARSLELMPLGYNAAHSVAHVEEESDRPDEGDTFLDGWLVGKSPEAPLYGHLNWHQALFKLATGDYAGVLELYRLGIGPSADRPAAIATVSDSAALLWRLDLREVAVDLPWGELCDYIDHDLDLHNPFVDLHCALSYAAGGRSDQLGALIDDLRAGVEEGRITAGECVPAIAEGIAAFAAGDYDRARQVIAPFEDEIARVGGSHAQWQVFEDTLLESYLRTEHFDEAAALLQKRLDRRPSRADMALLEESGSAPFER